MWVDDKLAKEKLIREVHRINSDSPRRELSGIQVAQLIRNTDLTDCQQPAPVETEVQHVCGVSGFAGSGDVCPRCELNARKRSASANAAWETRKGLIAPAPDQGSVRNATDEQDAKRYRWLRSTCFTSPIRDAFERGGCSLDAAIDAAIRALPVLEDQKD